uniref:Aminoacyl-tRNA synthetase class II (D/K/N) domain-containing protein n=1 Tax=Leersia perrieri TaxID=77586 RepID=A0A0D9XYR1_9ORYZ
MASSSTCSSSSSSHEDAWNIECFKYSRRATLRSVVGRPDGGAGLAGERAVVGGWVRSSTVVRARRASAVSPGSSSPSRTKPEGNVQTTGLTCTEVLMSRVPLIRCIARLMAGGIGAAAGAASGGSARRQAIGKALVRINDGSCVADLQIVVDSSLCPLDQVTATGACVLVEGKIEQVEGTAPQYVVQMRVEKILHIGPVDSEKYPLSNALPSSDLIRSYPHLAARTEAVASIARVRSELIHAVHAFFQSNGFFHVNTPIITTTSAGNRSKMFRLTGLFSKSDNDIRITPEAVRAAIKEKTKQIEALKRSESNKEALEAAEQDLQRAKALSRQLEQSTESSPDDLFHCPAYLTPCHTLHLETFACALSSVYTFSPAFQAEILDSDRSLAERWTLDDAISCTEDCVKSLCSTVSKDCSDELKFLSSSQAGDATNSLIGSAVSSPWEKIKYTEAVNTLLQVTDKTFESKLEWGMPLSHEHLSYLADDVYKKPLIIYEYPKQLKPFYARLKEDFKTVSAFDLVVPKVGIVACGAQKEERMDNLTSRIEESGLQIEQLEWYLDTRRHGTVKHSGFSIDLERLILFVTGLKDVQDTNPFCRTKDHAKC